MSERVEQAHIVRLLRTLSAAVYTLGTVRKYGDYQGTMQTPGLPDVLAFLPDRQMSGRLVQLWVEVKTATGRMSPAQRVFMLRCAQAQQAHIVGGLDEVILWLTVNGYLNADQVPHYRRPTARVTA